MSSFLIKVAYSGQTKEYVFNQFEPIKVGNTSVCELNLESAGHDSIWFEIQMIHHEMFILSHQHKVYMNSVELPRMSLYPLKRESVLTVHGKPFQIFVSENESIEPPPFSTEDFAQRLSEISAQISLKNQQLHVLGHNIEKKEDEKKRIEDECHKILIKKNESQEALSAIKSHKTHLESDLGELNLKHGQFEKKINVLRDQADKMRGEGHLLSDQINIKKQYLENIRVDIQKASEESVLQKNYLGQLDQQIHDYQGQISVLVQSREARKHEIDQEKVRLERTMKESQKSINELGQIKNNILRLTSEKESLILEIDDLKRIYDALKEKKEHAELKFLEIKQQLSSHERQLEQIKMNIQEFVDHEKSLHDIHENLRQALMQLELEVSHKTGLSEELDFKNNKGLSQLQEIEIKMDQVQTRLTHLIHEEKNQERKLHSAQEEYRNYQNTIETEKRKYSIEIDDFKNKLNLEVHELNIQIQKLNNQSELKEKSLTDLDRNQVELKKQMDQLHFERKKVQSDLDLLKNTIDHLHIESDQIRLEKVNLSKDKCRLETELSHLQLKLKDVHDMMVAKKEAAIREIDQLNRIEREKLNGERVKLMTEIETIKQKGLIEVNEIVLQRQNEIQIQTQEAQKRSHLLIQEAQDESIRIVDRSKEMEKEITEEASLRLKKATDEAELRESRAHDFYEEAQTFLKNKEKEGELLLAKMRRSAQEEAEKAQKELEGNLTEQKRKIKQFLTLKQQTSLKALEESKIQNGKKLASLREEESERLDHIKRKELKKIVKLREVELDKVRDEQKRSSKDLKEQRERNIAQFKDLKSKQDEELNQFRKNTIDQVNQMKLMQQQSWQEELAREKENFERSKKQRVQFASDAVIHTLKTELGSLPELPISFDKTLKASLEMALNGQNIETIRGVEETLKFDPNRKKDFWPVIKQYSLSLGIPAAIALVLVTDLGSLRSGIISSIKDFSTQKQSASEMYVQKSKDEWKEKYTYTPDQTPGYKESYAQNVLYTKDFLAVMDNEAFQNDWILKLNDFMVKNLELSEDMVISYISSESTLIKDLSSVRNDIHPQHIDIGLKKMNDLEETHLGWFKQKVTDSDKLQKFYQFRKESFDQFYQDKFVIGRDIASEKKTNN